MWDIYLDAERRSSWSVTVNDFTIFVNQKLGEVPLDAVSKKPAFAWFQKLVDWSSLVTVHINLYHIEIKSKKRVTIQKETNKHMINGSQTHKEIA